MMITDIDADQDQVPELSFSFRFKVRPPFVSDRRFQSSSDQKDHASESMQRFPQVEQRQVPPGCKMEFLF